jgi:hypothetical protein
MAGWKYVCSASTMMRTSNSAAIWQLEQKYNKSKLGTLNPSMLMDIYTVLANSIQHMFLSENVKCRKRGQVEGSRYHIFCQCPLAGHRLEIPGSVWLGLQSEWHWF